MLKELLVITSAAVISAAIVAQPGPARSVALGVIETLPPLRAWACSFDQADCLARRQTEIAAMSIRIDDSLRLLMAQRVANGAAIADWVRRKNSTAEILSEGRAIYDKAVSRKRTTAVFAAVSYAVPELKRQLAILFDEHAVAVDTIGRLKASADTLDASVSKVASLRSRVAQQAALLPGQIAAAQAGALIGDLDRSAAEVAVIGQSLATEEPGLESVLEQVRSAEQLNAAEAESRPAEPEAFQLFLESGELGS